MRNLKNPAGLALAVACLAAAAFVARGGWERQGELTPEEARRVLLHSPLAPPPADPTNRVAGDPAAARLGQSLFFDGRLSSNGRVACATCHDPARGWSNGERRGKGLGTTARHVPALWNTAYNRWYFWDGRADTLWAQALQPLEAREEMGGDRLAVVRTLAGDPALSSAYEEVFGPLPDLAALPPRARPVPGEPRHALRLAWESIPAARRDEINRAFANAGKALAAYERRIVSADAPFDAFAAALRRGDRRAMRAALSAPARRGLKLFVGRGNCILCHSGPNFTDGEFHNLRLPEDTSQPLDSGRYEGTDKLLADEFNSAGRYSDDPGQRKVKFLVPSAQSWGQFKTPSLRNVAQTAPYTHDGVFASLEEVMRFYSTLEDAAPMGHHDESILTPLSLDEREIADLVAFLHSLTGEPLPAELVRPPAPGPRAALPSPGLPAPPSRAGI